MAHRTGRRGAATNRRHESGGQARRAQQARWRRVRALRRVVRLRTVGIGALMVGTVLAFLAVLAFQSSFTRQPDSSGWVSLASSAPADVLSAARSTSMYSTTAAAHTPIGQALQDGTLGTPVLVHAYHPTPGMLDVWVIPVLEPSAPGFSGPGPHVVALLDFAYDAANNRIRATTFAGPFVPGDPEYGQPFPRVAAPAAQSVLAHDGLATGASTTPPELVYFPVDLTRVVGPHATTTWTGGGQFPDLAVWRVAGAQGQDYVVGLDSRVYTPAQLPLVTGAGG